MKQLAKQSLERLGVVAVSTGHGGARYLRHPPGSAFESVLLRLFPDLNGLNFVQVGANDGVRVDPLRPFLTQYGWSGIMLEPLPYNFAALQQNCGGNDRVRLWQAAVDNAPGRRLVYDLRRDIGGLPDWARGLGSFSRDRVAQAASELGLGEEAISAVEVETVTWDAVWQAFGARRCDLLVTDTEGHDIALLRAANLAQHKPRLVHFEHACVGPEERLAFYRELIGLGYELATDAGDTTAWLRE